MNKLVMLKGLPGSGKTSWAKEVLAKDKRKWKRVNKDDLRAMLDNGKWSRDNEKFILHIRNTLIEEALDNGYSVLVDDTNLAPKHEKDLRKIAEYTKSEFNIQDFTHIPLQQCIEQDLKRLNSVGEKVIRGMYNQFLKSKPERAPWKYGLPNAVICDIDGTLALFGDNNPYERAFISDVLNKVIYRILCGIPEGTQILLTSGRNDKFREETQAWLALNDVPYAALFMRKEGDQRKDYIIKREIYENHIKGKYNIEFVLDDRNQVVELWRSLGLTCLQVADGAF